MLGRMISARWYGRIATSVYLPFVLQERVKSSWHIRGNSVELRVAGTVGSQEDEYSALVTASRLGAGDEPAKVLYPVALVGPSHERVARDTL